MKQRLIYGFVIAVLTVNLIVGAWIYLSSGHESGWNDSASTNLDLFSSVLEKVRTEYVDDRNLTYHGLIYAALKGMISSLDPHSEFMDPAEYLELQSDTEGKFGGLGIVVTMKDNYVTVVTPMDGSPGFRAGILAGDRIIKINGKSAERMPLPDAVKLLHGNPGTQVTVTIQRSSSGLTMDLTLTRAVINVDMVKDINGKKEFQLGPDKIGYIRITQFGDRTDDELELALDKLRAQGMDALILDLRWNPGGLLDEAVEVCSEFLPPGKLVVTTEGRNPGQNTIRRVGHHNNDLNAIRRNGNRAYATKNMPIVVLVNLGSASASEIVAGCLQDLHRAVIVGEKTFGKGSVQSVFPLDDGSALKLTTAKYYTPSHRVIQENGVTPDIIVPVSDIEEAALILKRAPGGLGSLRPEDRARVEGIQDVQLGRAEDLLEGILLYSERTNSKTPEKMAVR